MTLRTAATPGFFGTGMARVVKVAALSAPLDVGVRVRDRHLGIAADVRVGVDVGAAPPPFLYFPQLAGNPLARLERVPVAHASEERRRIAVVRLRVRFRRLVLMFPVEEAHTWTDSI